MGHVRRWQKDAPTVLPSKLSVHYFTTTEPCFYHKLCNNYSCCNKQGKGVCRACADSMNGQEYPLKRNWYVPPTAFEIIRTTLGMFYG